MHLTVRYEWPDTWGDISAHVLEVAGLRATYYEPHPPAALTARVVARPRSRPCQYCQALFVPTHGRQRYCPAHRTATYRMAHGRATRRAIRSLRRCAVCYALFEATHGNQRNCPRHSLSAARRAPLVLVS